jgi:sigma-B regulation protein RsbU (phosphoserine phosphatase)
MDNQDKGQKKNGLEGKDKDREQNNLPLILIAEDDAEERELLGKILKKEPYRISIADNGRQTIETVFNAPPDLILLDVLMPEMDGFEVCKKLKESPETLDIPIIFITGLIDEIEKIKGLQYGAVDYLTKPFNSSELLARIRTHVDLKRSKQALKNELSKAGTYLKSLLPRPLKDDPPTDWRFRVSGKFGGDIFGYHWVDEDHFAIYLLDVNGHGMVAALVCVSIINLLNFQILENTDYRDPSAVLAALNDKNQNKRSFSIWYGVYKRTKHKLIYSSAGHPPALLLTGPNAAGAIAKTLETSGAAVGITPDCKYENHEVNLHTFNRLFVFSDGTYKIRKKNSGEMWELQEWMDLLEKSGRSIAPDLDHLLRYVQDLAGNEQLDDDFALLAIELQDKRK